MSARWNQSNWDEGRWVALTVADLLQQPPNSSHGVPTGVGDWRLCVEILLPLEQESSWGVGKWGTAEWNVFAWQDITDHVRGLEWVRGGDEPYGRPRVGELTVTLDSEGDRFSPWNATPPLGGVAYFGPGTIIRVGVRSATDTRASGWLPQITALVDTWGQTYVGANGADKFVDVTAFETLRDLAQIDDNASASTSPSETPILRFDRLLDAAGWRYGFKIEAQHILSSPLAYVLQGTNMTLNRLAECYLAADSVDAQFRTDRTGAALLTNIEYVGTVGAADPDVLPLAEFSVNGDKPAIGFDWDQYVLGGGTYVAAAYQTESFQSYNSDDAVMNDARFARVGGSQQVAEQPASISRHGRRTLVRNDFVCVNDAVAEQIARYTTTRRALNTLRVDNLTVSTSDLGNDHVSLAVMAADIQSVVYVYPPLSGVDRPYIFGFISGMTHRVTPRNGGEVTWESSFRADTRLVYNLPAAQLPDAFAS